MISGIKQLFFAAPFIVALACPIITAAAEKSVPATSSNDASPGSNADQDAVDMNKTIKKESRQPMNLDEPMPTGMAKKGMKKGDVKAHAKKKDATMDEMMKQEQMKK